MAATLESSLALWLGVPGGYRTDRRWPGPEASKIAFTRCNTSQTTMRPGTTDWLGDTPLGRPTPPAAIEIGVPKLSAWNVNSVRGRSRNSILVLLHSSPASLLLQGQSRCGRPERSNVLLHYLCSPQARVDHVNFASHSAIACATFLSPKGMDPMTGRYVLHSSCTFQPHCGPAINHVPKQNLRRQYLRTNLGCIEDHAR